MEALGPAASRAAQRLAEQTPAYLENCRLNVVAMLAALDRGDFQVVTILGHTCAAPAAASVSR